MCLTGTSMTLSLDYDGNQAAFFDDPWGIPAKEVGSWERTVEVISANRLDLAVGDYTKKCFASLIDHGPLEVMYDFSDIVLEPNLPLMAAKYPGILTITFQLMTALNTPATLIGHGGIIQDGTPPFDSEGNTQALGTLQWQFDGWTDSDRDTNGPVWTPETPP
jgi:hypothetical protein